MPQVSILPSAERVDEKPGAEAIAREVRRLKPPAPIRSYTVILFGLLAFTAALVVFIVMHSR